MSSINRLREQLNAGLSVHGLSVMIDSCTNHLKACAGDGGDSLVGVFALRGILIQVRGIVDDEGFPDTARINHLQSQYWPLLEDCVEELAAIPTVQPQAHIALERALRKLFAS